MANPIRITPTTKDSGQNAKATVNEGMEHSKGLKPTARFARLPGSTETTQVVLTIAVTT